MCLDGKETCLAGSFCILYDPIFHFVSDQKSKSQKFVSIEYLVLLIVKIV